MKDKYLFYLNISYVLFFGMVPLSTFYFHSNIRAILLLIAFIPVIVIHVTILLDLYASKPFIILSFLWITKFVFFAISEGLNYFLQKQLLLFEWIDVFLLLIIALMVSLSLLIKNPFWYVKAKSRIYRSAGVLTLIFSGWITLLMIIFLLDFMGHSDSPFGISMSDRENKGATSNNE